MYLTSEPLKAPLRARDRATDLNAGRVVRCLNFSIRQICRVVGLCIVRIFELHSGYGPNEQIVQEHFNQDKLEVTTDSFVSYRLKNVRFMSSLLQSYTIEGLHKLQSRHC